MEYVRSPYAGTIVEQKVVVGERVRPGDELYTVRVVGKDRLKNGYASKKLAAHGRNANITYSSSAVGRRDASNTLLGIIEASQHPTIRVAAPVAGVVVHVNATLGASVAAYEQLLVIKPQDESLVATFIAPEHIDNVLAAGQTIQLRIPDSHKLHRIIVKGVIRSIDSRNGPTAELAGQRGRIDDDTRLLQVVVSIRTSSQNSLRSDLVLRPGMRLKTTLRMDTKPLYQWILVKLNGAAQ